MAKAGIDVPPGSTPAAHERVLRALPRLASRAAADGSLTLGWTQTPIVARLARAGRGR